ncbi:MAG: hypothetical protein K6B74_04470, partial [Ruminococcus sp.]|nr:hypothetical protein [Ruminococcus sp.]
GAHGKGCDPVCGRVVMSGSMTELTSELDEIIVSAVNAGAKKIFMPEDSRESYDKLSERLKDEINVVFYQTPLEAARMALGVE